MKTLIYVLLATLVFGGRILYLYLQKRKKVKILPVEAGPIADAKDEDFITPVIVRVGDLQMDPSLEYFVVRNQCMRPMNINEGDIIGVQLLDETFTIDKIKKGDILLIKLDDDNFRGHKIRVMDYPENDAFHTYYFIEENRKNSHYPHKFNNIRGVVKEIHHLNNFAA